MNTPNTLQVMRDAPQDIAFPTMADALADLRSELERTNPRALRLLLHFEPWAMARRRPPGAHVERRWLRRQVLLFPFWRADELFDRAIASCLAPGGAASRLSGLRSVWPELRALVAAAAARGLLPVGRGLGLVALWLICGAALLLSPTFFFDFGKFLRAFFSS